MVRALALSPAAVRNERPLCRGSRFPKPSLLACALALGVVTAGATASARTGPLDTPSLAAPDDAVVVQGAARRLATRLPRALVSSVGAIELDGRLIRGFTDIERPLALDLPVGADIELPLRVRARELAPGDPEIVVVGADITERATVLVLEGGVDGVDDSRVFVAQSAAGTFGFVELPWRTYLISSGPHGAGLPTVTYDPAELPEGWLDAPAWTCGAVEPEVPPAVAFSEGGVAGSPCRQVRVAFDTDHEFLGLFAGDADAAVGYVETLASALNAIYTRDLGVRIAPSYIRLWPEPADPWTASTTNSQLAQFKSHWDASMVTVQRDLAHLLSGRALGGGVAYLPGLCGGFGYGVSANLAGFFPTPLLDNSGQNWDIYVVAHEIGHNFGAPHTNSYNPPLDGCGSSPMDCSDAANGTIMSYCHQCPGGVGNIRLGFHPSNIASMQATLDAVACNYEGGVRAPIAIADTVRAYTGVAVAIDVLANDLEFNCESVVIEGFTPFTLGGGTVVRSSGTGISGLDELVYLNESPGFSGSDSFVYIVRDASGQTAQATVTVEVGTLRKPDGAIGTTPGLSTAYYALSAPTLLPDFDALTPYTLDTIDAVDIASSTGAFATSGRLDNVGALFTGWITVPESGGWTFSLQSDDGSRLLIGDEVVVSHDGIHSFTERSGTIGLAAGTHRLRIEFFERSASAGLIARWEGPGLPKSTIPASALSHGGSLLTGDFTGDGRVNGLDLALFLSGWGAVDSEFDLTGDGLVTGADLTIFLFNWTD